MRTLLLTVTALLLATSARADGPPAWDGSYATPAIIQFVAAPVVIQDQPPKAEDWETHNRIADLQRRVAALEAEHAKMGLRTQPQTMPVPAGYQTTQATSSSYFAASVPLGVGDAGACASGDCSSGGRSSRAGLFGGRFRRR